MGSELKKIWSGLNFQKNVQSLVTVEIIIYAENVLFEGYVIDFKVYMTNSYVIFQELKSEISADIDQSRKLIVG